MSTRGRLRAISGITKPGPDAVLDRSHYLAPDAICVPFLEYGSSRIKEHVTGLYGTVKSACTWRQTPFGPALNFPQDTTNGYVEWTNFPAIPVSSGYTYFVLFNAAGSGSSGFGAWFSAPQSSGDQIGMWFNGGLTAITVDGVSGDSAPVSVSTNTWYAMSAITGFVTNQMMVGQTVTGSTGTGGGQASPSNFRIGWGSFGAGFNGLEAAVYVYKRILSDTDRRALYSQPFQMFYVPSPTRRLFVPISTTTTTTASGGLTLSAFSLSGTAAEIASASAGLTLPAYTLSASESEQAASAALTLAAFLLSATASETESASATFSLPAFTLAAAASEVESATAALTLPPYALSSTEIEQAATAALTLPAFLLASAGTLPGDTAAFTLPTFSLAAAVADIAAAGGLTIPAFALAAAMSEIETAAASLTLPPYSLSATEREQGASGAFTLPSFLLAANESGRDSASAGLQLAAFILAATARASSGSGPVTPLTARLAVAQAYLATVAVRAAYSATLSVQDGG